MTSDTQLKMKDTRFNRGRLPVSGTLAEVVAAAKKRHPKTYHSTVRRTYRKGMPSEEQQVEVLTVVNGYHGRRLKRTACYEIV